MLELDRIDRKLLAHLQRHARASNVELSAIANLSAPQCFRRHRRLEQAGVIVGYETRLSAARLGFGVTAFIHVTMDKAGSQLAFHAPAVVRGPTISLEASALPWYAGLSLLRMLAAYALSLAFAVSYGLYACLLPGRHPA